VLREGPIGYGVGEVWRVANCGRHVDPQRRMMPADIVEQPGQIFLEMPALSEKQRDDGDVPDILRCQSGNGRFEARLHHFQKRQFHANAGLLPAQPCHHPAERLRPRRIAGAMCKQKDGGSWMRAQWSVKSEVKSFHRRATAVKGIIAPAVSVANRQTGRSSAAG